MDSTLFEDFYFMDIFSDEEDVTEKDQANEKSSELKEFENNEVVVDCNLELTKLAHLSGLENLECLENDLAANKEESFELTSLTPYLNTLDLDNIELEIENQQSVFKTQFLDEIEFSDFTSTPAKFFSKQCENQDNQADNFHQVSVNKPFISLVEGEASKSANCESLDYDAEDNKIDNVCEAGINQFSVSITKSDILEHKETVNTKFETNHSFDDLNNQIETQSTQANYSLSQKASEVIDQQPAETHMLDDMKDQEHNLVQEVKPFDNVLEKNECSGLSNSKSQVNEITESQKEVYEHSQQADKSFEKKAIETAKPECSQPELEEQEEEKAHDIFESEIPLPAYQSLLASEAEQREAKLEASLAAQDTLSKSEVLEKKVDLNDQLLENETFEALEKVDTVLETVEKIESYAQIAKPKVNVIIDLHDSFLETQFFEAVEALTMAMEDKPDEEEENKKRADQLLNQVENEQEHLQPLSVHETADFEEIDLNSVHSEYTPFKSKSFQYNDTVDMLAEDLACLKLGNNTITMMSIKDELSDIIEQEEEGEANDSFTSAKSDFKDEPELEKSEAVSSMEDDDFESLPLLSPIKECSADHEDEEELEGKVQSNLFVNSLKDLTDSEFILPTPIKDERMTKEEKVKDKPEAEVKAVSFIESTHDNFWAPSIQSIENKESFAEIKAGGQSDDKLDDDFLVNDDLNRLSLNFKSKMVASSTIGNLEEDTLQILDLTKLDSELAPIDCLNSTNVSRPSGEKELSSTKYESSSSLSNELEVAFIRSKLDMTLGSIREDNFAEMNELRLSKIENQFETTNCGSLNSSLVQSRNEPNKSVNLIRKNISTPKSCLKSELTFYNKSDLKTEKSRKSKTVTFISPDVSQTTRKSSFVKIVRTPIVNSITDENVRPARSSRTPIFKPIMSENVQSPGIISTSIVKSLNDENVRSARINLTQTVEPIAVESVQSAQISETPIAMPPVADENRRPSRISRTPVAKMIVDKNIRPARVSKTPKLLESSQKGNVTRSPLIKLDLQNSPLNTSSSKSTASKPKNFVSKFPTLVSRIPVTTMTTKSPKTSVGFAVPTTNSKIKPPGEFAKPASVLKNGTFKIPKVKPHKDTPRAKPKQILTNRPYMSTVYPRPIF